MIVISSPRLSVGVLEEKCVDIVSIVDAGSGVDVLFRAPWAGASPAAAWDSRSRWLAAYRGGWQLLCPNAGPERVVNGGLVGFHGEAALVPWSVRVATDTSLTCETALFTAPLRLERTLRVDGRSLVVEETVENLIRSVRDGGVVEQDTE